MYSIYALCVYWLFIYSCFILSNHGYYSYLLALVRHYVKFQIVFKLFIWTYELWCLAFGAMPYMENGVPAIRDVTVCWLNGL